MYEYLNGTKTGSNILEIFIYANSVTHGFAVPAIVLSFFILVFVSSLMMQLRFAGRIRPEVSFLASSFATFGFAVILEQTTGLLNPVYFFLTIGATLLGMLWVFLTE
jgi:hypothetical protein